MPNAGDYWYVTENKVGIVKEKANITNVIRSLSNPANHQITIETVDTNTEELIGKLVTAANTIYSKEQIYNRSAVIKSDGTIAQDTVSASLDDNSGKLTIMSNNGTVLLGENGIITTDRENADLRMQYTGKGIFSSTNGGTTWENILNAGKISIKALSAGTIDSNTISVSNIGKTANIIIDGKGITAISKDGVDASAPNIIPDDKTSFFLDAKSGNAYFAGRIKAKSGDIGGWNISGTALIKGGVGMSSDNSSSSNYAFWAGNANPDQAKFWVKHDGTMKATEATIEGTITSNNATITGGSLKVGDNFSVESNGNLTAKNANVSGNITTENLQATGGNISNLIADNITANNFTMNSGQLTIGSNFKVTSDGKMTCKSANIKGSISGSTISGSTIYTGTSTSGWIIVDDYIKNRGSSANGGRANIFANGTLSFYPKLSNSSGGTFLLNDGARISMNAGVAISSNSDGSVKSSDKNLDLKACNDATVYIGSMSDAKGSTESSAIMVRRGSLELRSATITTFKHGSTTLVQGREGYVKIGGHFLGFANGICVYIGDSESEAKSNVGTSGPIWTY